LVRFVSRQNEHKRIKNMNYSISINQVETSRVDKLDFSNIPLGTTFTDHMFICDYENGQWVNPRIEPMGNV